MLLLMLLLLLLLLLATDVPTVATTNHSLLLLLNKFAGGGGWILQVSTRRGRPSVLGQNQEQRRGGYFKNPPLRRGSKNSAEVVGGYLDT